MKTKSDRKQDRPSGRPAKKNARSAYGDAASICINTACALRKKAKCFGFEGCPGFQAR